VSRFLTQRVRDVAAQEAAIFSAWFRRDALLADKWLAQVAKPSHVQYLTRLRVDIATNCAHGDLKEALQAWDEGLEYIEMLPHTRVQATLREGWVEWQAQIQERQTAIASAADQSSDSSVSRNLAT
jgi:hypothetical protein